jgi:hemoglobin-like flavoprotein
MTDIDEIFSDSYERCLRQGDFFEVFYGKYIASNEVVAQKFSRVDMSEQMKMLEVSLHKIMALRSAQPEEAIAYFRRVGMIHGRAQQDIAPELYDLWEKCLLASVKECDDQYDAQVAAAWTEVLSGGIAIMKSMY